MTQPPLFDPAAWLPPAHTLLPRDPRAATAPVLPRMFNPALLTEIADGYAVTALQSLVLARGGTLGEKRQDNVKAKLILQLVQLLPNSDSIDRALSGLALPAQAGLAYLKEMGGLVPLKHWQKRLAAYFDAAQQAQAERDLTGRALAFYAQPAGALLRFTEGPNRKHDIGVPAFPAYYGGEPFLVAPPMITRRFTPTDPVPDIGQPLPLRAYTGDPLHPAVPAESVPLLNDLLALVRYIEQTPILLLQSGDVGKRDFSRMAALLTRPDALPVAQAKKMSELGRLHFLWGLLGATGLIRTGAAGFVVTVPALVDAFFALPRVRQLRVLLLAWTRSTASEFLHIPGLTFLNTNVYDTDIPDSHRLTLARTYLLAVLNDQSGNDTPPEGWLDLARLSLLIREAYPDILIDHSRRSSVPYAPHRGLFGAYTYNGFIRRRDPHAPPDRYDYLWTEGIKIMEGWDTVEGGWLSEVFREPLAWLGLAELGIDAAGNAVAFRLSSTGLAVFRNQADVPDIVVPAGTAPELLHSLIVQPSLEVLVLAPLQHVTLVRQLDRFARQTSMGDVAVYQMSRESLLKGFRDGLSAADILTFLTDNSRVPVAPNVSASIRDWYTAFERLIMHETVTVLEVPDPAQLDHLLSDAATAAQIVKRLGPTFALIHVPDAAFDSALAHVAHGQAPLRLDYTTVQSGALHIKDETRVVVKATTGTPYLYYLLGRFADLLEWDRVRRSAVFGLSEAAGKRAQAGGLTYDDAVAVLEDWTGPRSHLSPATLLALKGWLGYYSPLASTPSITIRATQRSQLDDIMCISDLAALIIERPTPRTALVYADQFARFHDRLAALGICIAAVPYPPQPEESAAPTRRSETAADRDRSRREAQEHG